MKEWLHISIFSVIAFLSIVISNQIENNYMRIIVENIPYSLILIMVYLTRKQQSKIIFPLLVFVALYHLIIELYAQYFVVSIISTFSINYNIPFVFIFYLAFIIYFRKLGSGFYTKSKHDWYFGLPIGITIFLAMMSLYYDKIDNAKEPLLTLLSSFMSFFFVLGVNVKLPRKNYKTLILGLLFNLSAMAIGIHIVANESFLYAETIVPCLFLTSFFALTYSLGIYQESQNTEYTKMPNRA